MPESRKRKKKTTVAPHAQSTVAPAPSPTWWAPTMSALMVVGLIWVVVTYLFRGDYPIPGIGNWNLAIGFGLIMAGFLMTLRWR
jgi:hypothetical protein